MRRGQALLQWLLRGCLTLAATLRHLRHRVQKQRGVRRRGVLYPGGGLYVYPCGRHLRSTASQLAANRNMLSRLRDLHRRALLLPVTPHTAPDGQLSAGTRAVCAAE